MQVCDKPKYKSSGMWLTAIGHDNIRPEGVNECDMRIYECEDCSYLHLISKDEAWKLIKPYKTTP